MSRVDPGIRENRGSAELGKAYAKGGLLGPTAALALRRDNFDQSRGPKSYKDV